MDPSKAWIPDTFEQFYAPTLQKLRGHVGLGRSVRLSICPSVQNSGSWETQEPLMLESWNYICGMYMKNKWTRIFFPPPVLFWSYAPLSTMYEQPCEQNIWRTAKARILVFDVDELINFWAYSVNFPLSYSPFSNIGILYRNNFVNKISEEPALARILIFGIYM